MKNYILNNLPIVALLASFAIVPLSTVAAGLAFTFTGVIAMLLSDYSRNMRPVSLNAQVGALKATACEQAPLAA